MTFVVPEEEMLRELDEDTRRAWASYLEQLRDLQGEPYERVETDAWTQLQQELRRVDRRRSVLTRPAT